MPRASHFGRLTELLLLHLKNLIRQGAVSERYLAKLTGYSQPHIHNVVSGKRGLNVELADRILTALNISLDDLLDENEPVAQPEIPRWATPIGSGSKVPRSESEKYRVTSFRVLRGLVRPIACTVASTEIAMWPFVQGGDELIIDRSPARRLALRVEDIFLLDWLGVGIMGRCTRVGGSLVIVYANSAAPDYLPARLKLRNRSVTDIVIGRVAWLTRRLDATERY
jgi:transcriptional regulator with XRE-family HTH domain